MLIAFAQADCQVLHDTAVRVQTAGRSSRQRHDLLCARLARRYVDAGDSETVRLRRATSVITRTIRCMVIHVELKVTYGPPVNGVNLILKREELAGTGLNVTQELKEAVMLLMAWLIMFTSASAVRRRIRLPFF
ncbi:hypothetical protein RvY_11874 [Ramazzottius varieornatus]|uniref:Uncharacterized protein n=1 Tax=Ramazzottius varieornatus TaxID=947166 RepID=A0A1D1VHK7_RAMVA|nr:hypothetical protein RvY_11874 [Ramazzottius varieornatus]